MRLNTMRPYSLILASALALQLPQGAAAQARTATAPAAPSRAASATSDLARWKAQAARVTIMRDSWGIAHVYGKSDADAVFGMLYAQAEDDFNRVEMNYVTALGRMAEIEGESELYTDLRMKLFIDPAVMKREYAASPAWLKALMNGWADGLNYYLATHPETKPKLITRFEPWMALSFSEGSIGGDIAGVNVRGIEQFYAKRSGGASGSGSGSGGGDAAEPAEDFMPKEPAGSNGFAIGPSITTGGHAMLWINPHTTFYFRPEIHVNSEQGLSVYGAVTWGQFFVYQGFNPRLGWMHTTGGGDVVDEYEETVTQQGNRWVYKYGNGTRPLTEKRITLPFKSANGMSSRTITAYFTHHGPIVREANGKWVAVQLMQEPRKALMQSYLRTKATNKRSFDETLELRTNSSNNTVYADADGNIALYYGNFVPKRSTAFDFTKPVDGSNPATDWQGLHATGDLIRVINPANGWIQNTNNAPWAAAGSNSPKREAFPAYMWSQEENARGVHAVRVLSARKDFTIDRVIAAGYDPDLPAFDPLIPALVKAYDATPDSDTLKSRLAEQVALLRAWDRRTGVGSTATSLAIYWATDLTRAVGAAARAKGVNTFDYMANDATASQHLAALARASAKLTSDFGSWKTPWGEINRFQRLTGDIVQPFDDSKPSIPVGFPSANWGSLASFGATTPAGQKRMYGTSGNSFIAIVEFGPRIKAKSLLAGGVNGDPRSPFFVNQAENYAKGQFKDVLFYRADVEKDAKRTYHPGER